MQSARRGALKLKLTGKRPAQITPTMIKTPISTKRSVPVAAEMKNKSPNDRNCMIRLPISKEAAPTSFGRRKQGARRWGRFQEVLDACVRRQALTS